MRNVLGGWTTRASVVCPLALVILAPPEGARGDEPCDLASVPAVLRLTEREAVAASRPTLPTLGPEASATSLLSLVDITPATKMTPEGALVPRTLQEISCPGLDPFAAEVSRRGQGSARCVAMLEVGPMRVVNGYDIWKPALLMGVGEVFAEQVRDEIDRCHWCDFDPATGDRLNRVDNWGLKLRWGNPRLAGRLSWVTLVAGTGLVPAAVAGRSQGGGLGRFSRNFAIIAFAAFTADAATTGVKAAAARERPYSYRLTRDGALGVERSPDQYRSFFSGHTSSAFAATVVGVHLMDLYGPRHPPSCPECVPAPCRRSKGCTRRKLLRVAIWMPAFLTGYLRMAADKHFVTDVVGGAAAGLLVGRYVAEHVKPGLLLNKGRSAAVQPVPVAVGRAAGVGVSVSW